MLYSGCNFNGEVNNAIHPSVRLLRILGGRRDYLMMGNVGDEPMTK